MTRPYHTHSSYKEWLQLWGLYTTLSRQSKFRTFTAAMKGHILCMLNMHTLWFKTTSPTKQAYYSLPSILLFFCSCSKLAPSSGASLPLVVATPPWRLWRRWRAASSNRSASISSSTLPWSYRRKRRGEEHVS